MNVIEIVCFFYLSGGETVSHNEQQRREAVPLQDHRVTANQLPGRSLSFI